MSEEQSAGELMVFGLIEQADRLAKSTSFTQATLSKQIEELVAMEARVNAAVQSIHGAVKNLEGERVKLEAERAQLKAIGPTLQQNAVWAMRETLREQAGQIKAEMRTEVTGALIEPLEDIQKGARHVRDNVKETKWLTLVCYVVLGAVMGLAVGYMPLRSDVNALVEHVDNIDHFLTAKQAPPAVTAPASVPGKDHKGKGK